MRSVWQDATILSIVTLKKCNFEPYSKLISIIEHSIYFCV